MFTQSLCNYHLISTHHHLAIRQRGGPLARQAERGLPGGAGTEAVGAEGLSVLRACAADAEAHGESQAGNPTSPI